MKSQTLNRRAIEESAKTAFEREWRGLQKPMADAVPDGYMTTREWARVLRLSRPGAQHRLAQMLEANRMTRQRFRISDGSQMRSVWHYALKDP